MGLPQVFRKWSFPFLILIIIVLTLLHHQGTGVRGFIIIVPAHAMATELSPCLLIPIGYCLRSKIKTATPVYLMWFINHLQAEMSVAGDKIGTALCSWLLNEFVENMQKVIKF